MDQESMKNLLIRDKGFLKQLYEGPSPFKNKRILSAAEDSQLNTLIKYLHFLTCGRIHMKKEHFDIVERHKKRKVLSAKVETEHSTNILISASRIEKLNFLNKLLPVYSSLLYGLFNEM
jgi:hypothetical protein